MAYCCVPFCKPQSGKSNRSFHEFLSKEKLRIQWITTISRKRDSIGYGRMALSPFNHKSSVLCPKTKHITTQYLALEQIEAHHKMVSHAKHNLDTAAPKSMDSYISHIDRKKNFWPRETTHRYQSTFKNSDEFLQNNKTLLDNENFEEVVYPTYDKETIHTSMSLNKSIQTGIAYPTRHSKVADKISWYLEAVSQGEFQTQTLNQQNLQKKATRHYGSQISLSNSLQSYRVIKGDLIEWHKKHFTSAKKSFSPRILANNIAKSKVRDMRCYNPPQIKASHYSVESSETFDSYDPADDVGDEIDGKESETRESSNNENDSSVRNSDAGQQTWPNEQTLEANIQEKFGTKFKHQSCMANMLQSENLAQNKRYPFNSLHACNRNEDNYLKFLTDVTEDILRSGVYSDRAIQKTFEFHLQFCPENSDKEKLHHLLNQMLEGLRVHSDDDDDVLNKRNIPVKEDNIFIDKQTEDQKNTGELRMHSSDLSQVMESNFQDGTSTFSLNLVHSDPENNANSELQSKETFNNES